MASGTIRGSTSNSLISVKIDWTSTLYSDSNTSKVTAKLYYSKNSTEANGTYGDYSGSITINGNKKTISYKISSSDKLSSEDGWVLFGEHTVSSISHNSDGSKSVTISATGGISNTTFTSTSLSGTAKLDTNTQASLPVASISCSSSSGAIGSSVSITLSNTSSNCKYYLRWAEESDGTGKSTLISGDTYFTSAIWKPTEFQYSITSSGYIVCTTYESGGAEPIGKTSCPFTITEPPVYYIGPPTKITMSNANIIVKGDNINISWSAPSTSNKNNSISGYVVEYGTSTSFGKSKTVDANTTSASISTNSFSRGNTIWFRIYTKGSSDSEVSSNESRVYSSNYSIKINSLPSAPSVSFSNYTIPLGGSNPTITINAGSDTDNQTYTVDGYDSSTATPTLPPGTYYFSTFDGLETGPSTKVVVSKEADPTISLKTTPNRVIVGSNSSSYINKITITATLNKTSGYIKWYLFSDDSSTGVEIGQTSVTSTAATFVFDANSYFRSAGHTFKIQGIFIYIEGYTDDAITGTFTMPPALKLRAAYNQHDNKDVEGTSGLFYQNIRVYYTYDSEITSMTAACSQSGYPENTFSVSIASWTPGDSSKNYVDLAMPTNLISGAEYNITINASNGVYDKSASFTKTRMKSADFNNLVVTDGSTTLKPHTDSVLQGDLILSIGHQFGTLSSIDDIPYSEYFLDKNNWWKLKIGYGGNFVELSNAQLSLNHPVDNTTKPNTLYLKMPRSGLFNFNNTNWQNLFEKNYDRNYQTTIQFVVTNIYGMSSAFIGDIISYIFEENPVILEDSNISIERRYRLVRDEAFDSNIQYYSDVLGTKITNLTGFEEDKYYYVLDPKNTGAIPKGTTLRLQEGMILKFNPVFNEYNNGDVTVQVQVARRNKQITTNINSIPESTWINFGKSKIVGVNSAQAITTTPVKSSTIIEVQIPKIEEELFYYFRIKATDNTGLTSIYYFDHGLKTIKHTTGIIAIEAAEYDKKDKELVITISSDLNLGYSDGGEVLKAIVFYSNENASREWVSFPGNYSISIPLEANEDAANLSYQAIKITLDTLVSQIYEDIDFSNVVQFDSGSRTVFSGNVTVAYRKNRLGINTKNIGANDIITISPTNDRFKITFLQTEDSDEGSLYLDLSSGIFSGTAKYANQLTNARAINGQKFDGSKNITNFYICQTDAGTTTKVLSGFKNFTLQEGSEIVVYFADGNTASVPSIQNPNGTGSVPIQYRGEAFAKISDGDVLTFRYVSAENSIGETKVAHYEYVGKFIENTDTKVEQSPKSATGSFPILCSDKSGGVTGASGAFYNTDVYVDLATGKIKANSFEGNLTGKADRAGIADSAAVATKTNGTLTIQVNGSDQGTFDGSDSTINISVPTDYVTPGDLDGYITFTSLNNTLNSYATTSSLSNYVKKTDSIDASKINGYELVKIGGWTTSSESEDNDDYPYRTKIYSTTSESSYLIFCTPKTLTSGLMWVVRYISNDGYYVYSTKQVNFAYQVWKTPS